MSTKLIDIMRSLGRSDALKLRSESENMEQTEIIEREVSIPDWSSDKNYSNWPVGSPVRHEDQVWLLIQPHNASDYIGTPATLRALWGIAHTKNPLCAKNWMDPYGTSGMYMTGECYKDPKGRVFQALEDNVTRNAVDFPSAWKEI